MAKNNKLGQPADPKNVSTPTESKLSQQAEAPGSDVTDERLHNDDTNPESWLQYNKGLKQQGYSPADRITPENVGDIQHEYSFEIDGAQQNPIVVPSGDSEPPVMYFPEGQSVHAINARTGDTYWKFDYSPREGSRGGPRNRGVSVWEDKVYFCGTDLRVVALNRYTGEQQWKTHAVSERQLEKMTPSTARLKNTAAPLVFDGKVLKGQSGGHHPWGAFVVLDAETGEKLWDYDVLPPEEWTGKTWKYGDASPWTTPSVDPDSNTILLPTANPGPQLNGVVRPGPNKHSNSVVALDAETGEEKWVHQFVAHDWWDYDTYLTNVFDMDVDGETTRVVSSKDKTGWLYILDVETGKLLQRSEPYANQGAELPFMAAPPAGKENAKEKSPTATGATDWHPDGYSPKTGLVYLCSIDDFGGTWFNPYWTFDADSLEFNIGGGKESIDDPKSGDKATRVSAVDPKTGKIVWKTAYEIGEQSTPTWAGGNTPTGGNLVFGGHNGGMMRALNAETGEILWENQTDQSFSASPVVWDDPAEGKQYVAHASSSMLNVMSVSDSEGSDN